MIEITFIYGLLDPRTEEIRYVGKTNQPARRLRAHQKLRRGRNGKKASPKSLWVRELKAAGLAPLMVLFQAVPLSCWKHAEMLWIERLRRLGAPLFNTHDGGNGTTRKVRLLPRSLAVQALQAMALRVRDELSERWRQEYTVEWSSPSA